MTQSGIVLELDLPPSPNRWERSHWMERAKQVSRVKRATWLRACSQVMPSPEPPDPAHVHATFISPRPRDADNLAASLKPVLDALKQRPSSRDRLRWKQGLYLMRGYIVDDDPEHISLEVEWEHGSPSRLIVRIFPQEGDDESHG